MAVGRLRARPAWSDVEPAPGGPVPAGGEGGPLFLWDRAVGRRRSVHDLSLSVRADVDPAAGGRNRRHLPEPQARRRSVSTLDIGGSQLDASWFLLLSAVLFVLGAV